MAEGSRVGVTQCREVDPAPSTRQHSRKKFVWDSSMAAIEELIAKVREEAATRGEAWVQETLGVLLGQPGGTSTDGGGAPTEVTAPIQVFT